MAAPRCLIVCTSIHHHNTMRVAERMARVLDAAIVPPEACSHASLGPYGLLGIGSGVYYGGVHRAIRDWAKRLPSERAASLPVFIFTTSGLPWLAKLWTQPLRAAVRGKGFTILGEFSCRGFDTWGPLWLAGGLNRRHPDEHDLSRAEEFARGMAALAGIPTSVT